MRHVAERRDITVHSAMISECDMYNLTFYFLTTDLNKIDMKIPVERPCGKSHGIFAEVSREAKNINKEKFG